MKPGVKEPKTKQTEKEKWIGDADRRAPPEQGEEPPSVEVVTTPQLPIGLNIVTPNTDAVIL